MKYSYIPRGVCSTKLDFELDGDIVKNVKFSGGLQRQSKGNFNISRRHAGGRSHEKAFWNQLRHEIHILHRSAGYSFEKSTGRE